MTLNRSREANDALDHVIEAVEKEFDGVADGAVMTAKVSERFRDTFNSPPRSEFEYLFHKNFSDDEVIVALFQPREEQLGYFPLILEAAAAPSPVSLTNLRSLVLSLLFLVHRKHWTFLEQFILNGGLFVMSDMIGESNLYIRGQALEIVLTVIDCEIYDWFRPLQKDDYIQAGLHKQLLALVNHSSFLKNLLANRVGSYPGGSCRALQILAFWWSWLRAVHTQDQKLHLSAKVLSELKLWSEMSPVLEADGSSSADAAFEEELKLARTVYEDFGFKQYGVDPTNQLSGAVATEHSSSSGGDGLFLGGLTGLSAEASRAARVVELPDGQQRVSGDSAPKTVTRTPLETALDLKAVGNQQFKEGKVLEAVDSYQRALQLLTEAAEGADHASVKVDLNTNCATCWWKLYQHQQQPSGEGLSATATGELLSRCEASCCAALALSPHYPKAVYRLVTVLLESQRPDEALPLILSALQHHSGGPASVGSEDAASSIELLTNLRVRCIAAKLMRNSGEVGSLSAAELGMTPRGAQLLQSILQRNQTDAAVDWQIVRPGGTTETVVDSAAGEASAQSNEGGALGESADAPAVVDTGKRTAETSKWILEDLLNKNRLAAEARPEGKKAASSKAADKASSSSSGVKSASKAEGEKKRKTKAASSSEVTAKALAAFNEFKRLAGQFDNKIGSEVPVPEGKRAVFSSIVEGCNKSVDLIWAEGSQLCDVFSVCLEESYAVVMLHLASEGCSDADRASRIVGQLMKCDRFDVVMSLVLAGNSPFRAFLSRLSEKLNRGSDGAVDAFVDRYCSA